MLGSGRKEGPGQSQLPHLLLEAPLRCSLHDSRDRVAQEHLTKGRGRGRARLVPSGNSSQVSVVTNTCLRPVLATKSQELQVWLGEQGKGRGT